MAEDSVRDRLVKQLKELKERADEINNLMALARHSDELSPARGGDLSDLQKELYDIDEQIKQIETDLRVLQPKETQIAFEKEWKELNEKLKNAKQDLLRIDSIDTTGFTPRQLARHSDELERALSLVNETQDNLIILEESMEAMPDYYENPSFYTGEPTTPELGLITNTELEIEVGKFEAMLMNKYDKFIADKASDTEPFRHVPDDAPSFEITLINEKFLYVDLLTIKPEMQGKGGASAIMMEIMQYADEKDLHVIAIPVNNVVQKSMEKYGGKRMPGNYMYFGWKMDQALEDAKEAFKPQYESMRIDFENFVREITSATPEEWTLMQQLMNSSGDDATLQFMTEVRNGNMSFDSWLNSQYPGLSGEEVDQLTANIEEVRQYPEVIRKVKQYDFWKGLGTLGNKIQIDSYTNFDELTGNPSHTGTFAHWATQTAYGTNYVRDLVGRLSRENVTVNTAQLKSKMEQELRNIINTHVPGNGNQYRNANLQPFINMEAGKLNKPDINLDIDFSEITDREVDYLIKHMGTPDARNSNGFEFFFDVMDDLLRDSVLQQKFPSHLDVSPDGTITIYRAMSPIDAALGIRKFQFDDRWGGRTSGFGSLSYASSNANYPYEYKNQNNNIGREVYAIEITGLEPGDILDMGGPVYQSALVMDYLQVDPKDPKAHMSIDGFLYNNKDIDRKRFIKDMSEFHKVILNRHTGSGNGRELTYLDNRGGVVSYRAPDGGRWANSKPRLDDEFLITDETIDARVVGVVDTNRTNTNLVEANIKPFEPNKAVQNMVDDMVIKAKDMNHLDYLISGIENIRREIRFETANRKNMGLQKQLMGDIVFMQPEEQSIRKSTTVERLNEDLIKNLEIISTNLQAIRSQNPNISYEELLKKQQFNLSSQTNILTPGIWDSLRGEYIKIQEYPTPAELLRSREIDPDYQIPAPIEDRGIYVKKSLIDSSGNFTYKVFKVIDLKGSIYTLVDELGNLIQEPATSTIERFYFPEDRKSYWDNLFDTTNDITSGKVLNPILGVRSQGVMREDILLNPALKRLLTEPGNIIELGIVHSSPNTPISINQITSGAESGRIPIVDQVTGEVSYTNVGNDLRNKELLIGLSASFEDDIIKYNPNMITGKSSRGVPNYFLTRLNSDNILTQSNIMSGSWLHKFDIPAVAVALDVTPQAVYAALESTGLITKSKTGGYYGTSFSERSSRQFISKMNEAVVQLKGATNDVLTTRFLRAGGIDALIDNPNINFRNFQELMILDPNDQTNVGRAMDIIDIDEAQYKELGGAYKVVNNPNYEGNAEEPLRRYEDINTNLRGTALDEAYETRINFEQGFKNAELEAMGLLDDDALEAISQSNIVPSQAVDIVVAGQNTPVPTQLMDDATEAVRIVTAIAEDEYYQVLGRIDALRKAGIEGPEEVLQMLTYHNQASSKWRAIQGLKNTASYSIGKRGVRGTGFLLLDLYELSLWGGAAAYGTSDKWTVWFENIFKEISNKALGTEYILDEPGQIDYEKLDKSLQFAEKVDVFNLLFGPVIDDVSTIKDLYIGPGDAAPFVSEKETVSVPGYEYAPGYKTSDIELFNYNPNLASINATEIRQGEPINRFGAFFKNSMAKYKENKDTDRMQYYNTYSSNYLSLGDKDMEYDY